MRYYLLIVLFSVCVFGLFAAESAYAGKVNGQLISQSDFADALMGHYMNFVMDYDRKPTEGEWRQIYDTTWRNITKEMILRQAYTKYKITVGQTEAVDTLMVRIPEIARQNPNLMKDRAFSKDLYQRSLLTDSPVDMSMLRDSYRRYYIPQQKLKQQLAAGLRISEKEIKEQYAVNHATAKVLIFPFYKIEFRPVVTNAEQEQYYDLHKEDFAKAKSCDLGMAIWSLTPNHEDSLYTKARIDSLYDRLSAGESFQLLANKYSQAASAGQDGDLGYVDLNTIPEPAQTRIRNLEVGKCLLPVQILGQWVIYRVEDRTPNLVRLREIRLSPMVGDKTRESAKSQAIRIRDLASQVGLAKAATEMKATYMEDRNLSLRDTHLKDIVLPSELVQRAIEAKKGYLFEPVYRQDLDAWVVMQVLQNQPFNYIPFELAKDSILVILTKQKQMVMAREAANQFYQKHQKDNFQMAAGSGRSYILIDFMRVSNGITAHGSNTITSSILRLQKSNVMTSPVETEDGVFVSYCDTYRTPDFKNYEKEKSQIVETLRRQRMEPYFKEWMDQSLRKAKLSIWFKFKPLSEQQTVPEQLQQK